MKVIEKGIKLYSWKELKDEVNKFENTKDGYYHFTKDLINFPDAWIYIIWSRRGPGKTYSGLWRHIYEKIKIIYMKRTVEDVDTICKESKGMDLNPYKKLNNDKVLNIQPTSIGKGLGFFSNVPEGTESTEPISYIMALNKIKSVKGIEASECDWILLDEFIPQVGEIVRQTEGEQLLDLYMTILRDRVARGLPEIKLVLFANAEDISTPITNELEVVDYMAMLNQSGEDNIMYLEDKRIFLHHIESEEAPKMKKQDEELGIYQALKDTKWGRKTFAGEFANNDFSNVVKCSLKGMKGLCEVIRNTHHYYVYYRENDGYLYMTTSKIKCPDVYNLNLENDQKRFYNDMYFVLRESCIDGRMGFKTYSMYDLLINYKKFYNV